MGGYRLLQMCVFSLAFSDSKSQSGVGICFSNYTILHMAIPDNPKQPCLSCTKQWCLNQNLPICAGATLGDANPDTATGKEGDVEARCFRKCIHIIYTGCIVHHGVPLCCRARLSAGSTCRNAVPVDRIWPIVGCWYQGQNDQSRP